MPLASATGLAKHFGTQLLYENVSFSLDAGDRVGLIGANGTGKTTLFRILTGAEVDFDGIVSRQKGLRIGVLEQDPKLPPGLTIREAVLEASSIAPLERGMSEIHHQLALPGAQTEALLAKLGELQAKFEQADGYAIESLAERILEGVGLPVSRHGEIVDTLSGGERSRLALARLLLSDPDLWLLDEPTNHLDLEGIAFVEEFLSQCRASVLVISHDRHFLDAVTTRTWEIEGQRLWAYNAPYTRAKELREERIKAAKKAYDIQRTYIEKQEEYVRRFGAGVRARQARGRATRLARVARLDNPETQARALALNLPSGERLGAKPPLEVRDLSLDYGTGPLFQNLSFSIEPGETLGVVGPNGAGKTSLFRMLVGEQAPQGGGVVWGSKAVKGVLTQHEKFPEDATTPFRYLRNHHAQPTNQELRATLGAMCFSGDSADKPLAALSGGERKRLMMTRLLLEGNNVLLLDEPTNHLDLPSREALEFALSVFEGSLVLISHDRYFLDQLADRVLWIQDGQWTLTNGGFTEAQEARRKKAQAAPKLQKPKPEKPKPAAAPAKPKAPVSTFGKLSTDELEQRIIRFEKKVLDLLQQQADPALYRDAKKTKAVAADLESTQAELTEMEKEYEARG